MTNEDLANFLSGRGAAAPEVPHPGPEPVGVSDHEKKLHDDRLQQHILGLMGRKNAGSLNAEEQKTLQTAILKAISGGL